MMKNKRIELANENRCRYCNQVVLGLTMCACGGRQRDTSIWVQCTRRDRNLGKDKGGNGYHQKGPKKKNGKN